jgi:hypothetical protein
LVELSTNVRRLFGVELVQRGLFGPQRDIVSRCLRYGRSL